ncbi:acyltransferase family protein [Flavobacterium sp. RHBU_3]|uniref:acyltransferase family protein n=1 Tax=Flavobacterium sp. RHBU_3 TaxID=3391184 RepID=UPI0039846692
MTLTKHSKNPEIETLRALAILLVIFRHLHYSLPFTVNDYPKILQGTWSGVDLFFVISGFVITRSLSKNYRMLTEGVITTGQFLGAFYIRRIFRLLPVSLLILFGYWLLCKYFSISGIFADSNQVLTEAPYVIFYIYNLAVPFLDNAVLGWYWSLSIEEQFYFIYPFLLLFIKKNTSRLMLFVAIIFAITFIVRPIYAANVTAERLWPLFTTPTYLRVDLLFAGCIIALLNTETLKLNKLQLSILALISALMVSLAGGALGFRPVLVYPIILLFSFILVYIAATENGVIPKNRVLNWIGGRSYSIYLLNIPMIHFTDECFFRITGATVKESPLWQGGISLACSTLLMFLLAEVLFRYVEQPFTEKGIAISKRILSRNISA